MRVVVAMSGGVDSSVAALKLKEEGYDVIGVTIKTWPKKECGSEGDQLCCSLEAIQFARSVAEELEIPFYVVDMSKEFEEMIKKYFAEEYSRGRTPSPCIYCNSKLKFGLLLQKARELGAEKIATGHYARILETNGTFKLAESVDKDRDQSYFLYDVARDILPFVIFPLGEVSKDEVREWAAEHDFMTAWRKDSQDICFAPGANGDYRDYLSKEGVGGLDPGEIIDISGNVLGRHKGIASYTVGQRRGIGVAMSEPVYVVKIDPDKNTITLGNRENSMEMRIRVCSINWMIEKALDEKREIEIKIRSNGRKIKATIIPQGDNEVIVEFKDPQFAPTPGQAAVFYDGEIVIGGGWIEEVL